MDKIVCKMNYLNMSHIKYEVFESVSKKKLQTDVLSTSSSSAGQKFLLKGRSCGDLGHLCLLLLLSLQSNGRIRHLTFFLFHLERKKSFHPPPICIH